MKASDMKVNIHTERVGKEFHIKAENPFGEPVTTVIDIQKTAMLTEEETAELVARLDAADAMASQTRTRQASSYPNGTLADGYYNGITAQ